MMLFFARQPSADPTGLVLTAVEASRQRAQRQFRARLARDAAARLLALSRPSAAARRND